MSQKHFFCDIDHLWHNPNVSPGKMFGLSRLMLQIDIFKVILGVTAAWDAPPKPQIPAVSSINRPT